MRATLIMVDILRSRQWAFDFRLLSFASEMSVVRGLLLLKYPTYRIETGSFGARLLIGLLWFGPWSIPLERSREDLDYISIRRAYVDLTGDARQPVDRDANQAGNSTGGDPCTVSRSCSPWPCSTSSGGCASSVSGARGDAAPRALSLERPPLSPANQAIVDHHRAMAEALGAVSDEPCEEDL